MTSFIVLIIVIGIIGLVLGVFVEAVKWLLAIGIILLALGVIAALIRFIRRKA